MKTNMMKLTAALALVFVSLPAVAAEFHAYAPSGERQALLTVAVAQAAGSAAAPADVPSAAPPVHATLAAQERSVSRKTVAEVPLTGLSFNLRGGDPMNHLDERRDLHARHPERLSVRSSEIVSSGEILTTAGGGVLW